MRIGIVGSILIMVITSGCASIVSTDMRQIVIKSKPTDARVLVKDEKGADIFKGETPTIVMLRTGEGYFHGNNYTVTISKEGFEELTLKINSGINGWYWGNFGFGGLIGFFIVDPLTGNMFTLSPQELNPDLVPKIANTADSGKESVPSKDKP